MKRALLLFTFSIAYTCGLYAQAPVLYVGTGTELIMSGNIYIIQPGNIQNNGIINSDSNSTITLNGPDSMQEIKGSAVNNTRFGKVIQDNVNGIQINTNVNVISNHNFVNGFTRLNNSNWRLEKNATISGNNSSSRFYQTNGLGLLYKNSVSGTYFTFPIGTLPVATSYTPLTAKNDSVIDNYGVRVEDGQYASYNSDGTGIGSAVSTHRVQKTWVLNEDTAGGSKATISVQWQGTMEGPAFDRTLSLLNFYSYTNNGFNDGQISAATGTDPYNQVAADITQNFSFSPISMTDRSLILPIELLSFEAIKQGANAHITWQTANEINSDYFELERSTDGATFIKINTQKALGESHTLHTYGYTDNNITDLNTDVLYYRLKQVDMDGSFKYSMIRVIHLDPTSNKAQVFIYPNPSSGNAVNIQVNVAHASTVSYTLFNLLGQSMYTFSMGLNEGLNHASIDVSTLAVGYYELRAVINNITYTRKVIISR